MAVPAHAGGLRAFRVADALAVIGRSQQKAAVPENGSWLSVMSLGLAQPEALLAVDGGPAGLSYIRVNGSELRIGSLTTAADLFASAVIGEHFAMIREAGRAVFSGVQRAGTIGAAICRADSAGSLVAALAAAGASVAVRGRRGTRLVAARTFRAVPAGTVIEPGELVAEIRLPIRPGGGSAYQHAADGAAACPATGVAAIIWLDRAVVTGVGLEVAPGLAAGARGAAKFLSGADATLANFGRAGDIAAAHCAHQGWPTPPGGDAPCQVRELVVRALRRAQLRAIGQDPSGSAS